MSLPRRTEHDVTTEPLLSDPLLSREGDVEEGNVSCESNDLTLQLSPSHKDFVEFPSQWRNGNCIITSWQYYSIATLIVVFYWPFGAILGIAGSCCYTNRDCMPKKNPKGMAAASIVHGIAFAALWVDILSVLLLTVFSSFLLTDDCSYAERLRDSARVFYASSVHVGAALTLVRFFVALNVFLRMRDYRREIHREELLEQRLQAEIEVLFREYQQSRQQLKASTSHLSAGESSSTR